MSTKAEIIKAVRKSHEIILSRRRINVEVANDLLKETIEQITYEQTHYHQAVKIANEHCEQLNQMRSK